MWMPDQTTSFYQSLIIVKEFEDKLESGLAMRGGFIETGVSGFVVPTSRLRREWTQFGRKTREERQFQFDFKTVKDLEDADIPIEVGNTWIKYDGVKYKVIRVDSYQSYTPIGAINVMTSRGIDVVD